MKKIGFSLLGIALLSAAGLRADTAETIAFLTQLLPDNETPPTSVNAKANVIVSVHAILDSNRKITSGSVDFNVTTFQFPGAVTITGLHIHRAPVGVAGPIVIPTDVQSIAVDSTGKGSIFRQVQFPAATGEPSLDTIAALLADPSQFYVNLHTTDFPSGAIRGQLLRAETTVLMGLQDPSNETPPIPGLTSSGVSTATVLRALDASGNLALADVVFNLQYTGFVPGTVFTGFHIHKGPAGIAGPVTINTGIGSGAASVPAADGGAGNLNFTVPISPSDASFAAEADTINGLFTNPNGFYINTHTTVNPGGEIRSQLHTTDLAALQVTLSPANETPPITAPPDSNATAVTIVRIHTVRNADGTIAAATVGFDVNYRNLTPGTNITGLHIHQQLPKVMGSIVIPTSLSSVAVDPSGNGNVSQSVTISPTFPSPAALTALNQLVLDPFGFYENLHTTVHTGGAIRSQLTAAAAAKPSVAGVAATASTILTAAPGSILSVYGSNLAAFTSDLGGFFQPTGLPTSMNGVTATIAGIKSPLYFVSPGQLNIQVPFEVANGSQPLIVTDSGGASSPFNVTVANAAPSIFIAFQNGSVGAIIKNSDFSLVTSDNPATAGDVILIYSTGLGQTTPTSQTGSLQPPASGNRNTVDVTVSIGGQPAKVIYSIASPGFAGLYQTAVTVPAGVTGTAKVVLSVGNTASNAVNLAVK